MHRSRPAAFLALVVTFIFAVSTVCLAPPIGSFGSLSGANPGGCHGHHGPTPEPAHNCCFSGHQIPTTTSIGPSPVSLNAVTGHVASTSSMGNPALTPVPVQTQATSPPLTTVLRI